jgi:hypothetical protein
MSTFSNDNGPRDGDISGVLYNKLDTRLDAAEKDIDTLTDTLDTYPGEDNASEAIPALYVKSLVVRDSLTIRQSSQLTVASLNATAFTMSGSLTVPQTLTSRGTFNVGATDSTIYASITNAGALTAQNFSIPEGEMTGLLKANRITAGTGGVIKIGVDSPYTGMTVPGALSAGSISTGNFTMTGSLNTGSGTITTTGKISAGALAATGAVDLGAPGNTTTVKGPAVLNASLSVTGASDIGGNLRVRGELTLDKPLTFPSGLETPSDVVAHDITASGTVFTDVLSLNAETLMPVLQHYPNPVLKRWSTKEPPYDAWIQKYTREDPHADAFVFYAAMDTQLPKQRTFFTEQGTRYIQTGDDALVLAPSQRLVMQPLGGSPPVDLSGCIYTARVGNVLNPQTQDYDVAWDPSNEALTHPAVGNDKNGWLFTCRFWRSSDLQPTQNYQLGLYLIWQPYLVDDMDLTIGNYELPLTLRGAQSPRPRIDLNGVPHDIAFTDEIASSIMYEGQIAYYVTTTEWTAGSYPQVGKYIPITSSPGPDPNEQPVPPDVNYDNWHLVTAGEILLVLDPKAHAGFHQSLGGDTAYWYDIAFPTVELNHITAPAGATGFAHQWHIDWIKEGTDTYYHESELIWGPYAALPDKSPLTYDDLPVTVSLINLPLENYYTVPETDTLLSETVGLFKSPDWLNNNEFETLPATLAGSTGATQIPNPQRIVNRPITGLSHLNGGNWDTPQALAWEYLANGGNWDELKEDRGTFATYAEIPAVDPGWETGDYVTIIRDETRSDARVLYTVGINREWTYNETMSDQVSGTRQNVIMQLYYGPSASLPAASEDTYHVLKYCSDTGELFIDAWQDPVAPGKEPLYRDGNLLVNGGLEDTTASFAVDLGTTPSTVAPTEMTGFDIKWSHYRLGVLSEEDVPVKSSDDRLSFKALDGAILATLHVEDIQTLLDDIQACTDATFLDNLGTVVTDLLAGGAVKLAVEEVLTDELPINDSPATIAISEQLQTGGTLAPSVLSMVVNEATDGSSSQLYAALKADIIASLFSTDFDDALTYAIAKLIGSKTDIQAAIVNHISNQGFQKTSRVLG